MRPVARAEPSVKVASSIAQRHTAQVGANTHHHQPFAALVERAVFVSGVQRWCVVIARRSVNQLLQIDGPRFFNLVFGPAPDKHRLAQPFNSQLGAGCEIRNIHPDR